MRVKHSWYTKNSIGGNKHIYISVNYLLYPGTRFFCKKDVDYRGSYETLKIIGVW